jgi:hypothetical protein
MRLKNALADHTKKREKPARLNAAMARVHAQTITRTINTTATHNFDVALSAGLLR